MSEDEVVKWAKWQHKEFEAIMAGTSVPHSLGEFPEEPTFSAVSGEAAYRRGFTHGFSYADDCVRRLYSRLGFVRPREICNILDEWNRTIAYPWRYRIYSEIAAGSKHPIHGHPELKHHSWAFIRKQILNRDDWTCVKCGESVSLEVDHIVSVSSGGLPVDSNLQTLCERCHIRKSGGR